MAPGRAWEAEFGRADRDRAPKISAPRARLLRRVAAWDADRAQAFADACALRARDHAVTALERAGEGDRAADVADAADAAVVTAYVAAHAAARVHGADAMAAERAWQSGWPRAELALEA